MLGDPPIQPRNQNSQPEHRVNKYPHNQGLMLHDLYSAFEITCYAFRDMQVDVLMIDPWRWRNLVTDPDRRFLFYDGTMDSIIDPYFAFMMLA